MSRDIDVQEANSVAERKLQSFLSCPSVQEEKGDVSAFHWTHKAFTTNVYSGRSSRAQCLCRKWR